MSRSIHGIEDLERIVGRWSPADLAYIERIELTTPRSGSPELTMTALFQRRDTTPSWPSESRPFHRVQIRFDGVRDLSMSRFARTPQQLLGFDIREISDRGMEGINFDIGDYEDGALAFRCSDIHVLTVETVA